MSVSTPRAPRSPGASPAVTRTPKSPSASRASSQASSHVTPKKRKPISAKPLVLVPKDAVLDERSLEGLEHGCSAYLYRDVAVSTQQATAVFNVGWMYYHGLGGCPAEPAKALEYFQAAGRQNHDLALYYAGRLYEGGCAGIPVNVKAALSAYSASSALGCSNAAYAVGKLLQKVKKAGDATLLSDFEGRDPQEWFALAAQGGHKLALDLVVSS